MGQSFGLELYMHMLFLLKTCREFLGFGWFRKVYQNAEEKMSKNVDGKQHSVPKLAAQSM